MEKLFVYGTLRSPEVQKEVMGRSQEGKPAVLEGYEREEVRIQGEEYPIAVPDKGKKMKGLLLRVTPQELSRLDEYETSAYSRRKAVLTGGEKAWVYQKPLEKSENHSHQDQP